MVAFNYFEICRYEKHTTKNLKMLTQENVRPKKKRRSSFEAELIKSLHFKKFSSNDCESSSSPD